ncbi:hypothetical protein [Yoonia sp.]|uniref:hypothetical protein n=1 Tax=Yoonia sp. TaxID=2212373 RepID=UPI0025E3099B|nr:hypothetical protein [Yoonia sp.]
MRIHLVLCVLLMGCATQPPQANSTVSTPGPGAATTRQTGIYDNRRGLVEIIVKANFAEISRDIRAGGGPVLTRAMVAAGIPPADRPTRLIQLQSNFGLYAQSPGALVTTLMLYGR